MDVFDDEPGPEEDEGDDHQNQHSPNNKLGLWQGVFLLTADCLGVGILALPEDIHVLGWTVGLAFLILQLPINYYAGSLLAWTAVQVEREYDNNNNNINENQGDRDEPNPGAGLEMTQRTPRKNGEEEDGNDSLGRKADLKQKEGEKDEETDISQSESTLIASAGEKDGLVLSGTQRQQPPKEAKELPPTVDLIGISSSVFDRHGLGGTTTINSSSSSSAASKTVLLFYYLNLFLILGDYILVMSHAVAAMLGDELCITTAGLIASTLMFAICQLDTMALLGQYVAMASLAAMMVVLGQCIYASHQITAEPIVDDIPADTTNNGNDMNNNNPSLLRKFSALASICFAVGSQKLFLNIRYELKDKEQNAAPVLARSLTLYGMAYVAVILLSGSDPPSFLFDTIAPGTWNRRIAGFLLWCHVAVSYAINSQALCSSLERLVFRATSKSRVRWLWLTFCLAVSSYLVANGIPFFKDLVALIGAATTVPVTLTLPPILYQHWQRWTRIESLRQQHQQEGDNPADDESGMVRVKRTRTWEYISSSALLMYSIVFLGIGLAGSLASVKQDWSLSEQAPFACSHS